MSHRGARNWLPRFQALPRPVRIILVILIAAVIGFLINRYGPTWLAVLVGVAVAACVGFLVNRFGPRVLEAVTEDGPVRATVGDDDVYYSNGWKVVLPEALARDLKQPDPTDTGNVRSWFKDRGAFDADVSYLRLALEGRSTDPVRVTDIRAEVLLRKEPLAGPQVSSPAAGQREIIPLVLDLDEQAPRGKTADGTGYFDGRYLTLESNEVEILSIQAKTQGTVEWKLEIHYSFRGRDYVLRRPPADARFRTAASAAATERYVWAWFQKPPRLVREEDLRR